jgi:hypothetical protein
MSAADECSPRPWRRRCEAGALMTMPWRWYVQPSRAEADGVGGVDFDGEGPLFAEMRCDLSVVRKNLEAGRAEVSHSTPTRGVSWSIDMDVLPTWLRETHKKCIASS